ncbi:unnamed protein product [Schistosoma spindalis]|nr:unnamed protein product [Schistosoma spindale]
MDTKKIQADTNTFFGRFSQIVEEAFGTTERTNYSPDLAELMKEGEKRRNWAVSILAQLENVIQPNPALRIEDLILRGMNREKVRLSANEQLAESMDRISSLINKNSQYGKVDKFAPHITSTCIYQFRCSCQNIFIGGTERRLIVCISKHIPQRLKKTNVFSTVLLFTICSIMETSLVL